MSSVMYINSDLRDTYFIFIYNFIIQNLILLYYESLFNNDAKILL